MRAFTPSGSDSSSAMVLALLDRFPSLLERREVPAPAV
jgi:hypothetical protein